jgi:hypothetical protein
VVIEILNHYETPNAVAYEMTVGKKAAWVSFNKHFNSVSVCVENAAHRVWRGFGRHFHGFEAALAAYKSSEVKAMIEHVRSLVLPVK